jgi:hypothetical protein
LTGKKVTFARNAGGGYSVKTGGGSLSSSQGNPVSLTDDDTTQINFSSGFSFSFYGKAYNSVFLNSDGNLTFTKGDTAITERDPFRALSGPPRIAPFFQDLNPAAKGTVHVFQSGERLTITWNGVSQFFSGTQTNSNTFQVTLFKNGNVEFIYSSEMETKEAVVGIFPGPGSITGATFVNFSSPKGLTNINAAILERFATIASIDFAGLTKEFHRTHAGIFDFVVIFSDFPISIGFPGAFAFFAPVQNSIRGIGLPKFNFAQSLGSAKLQGILAMGWLGRFPDDPDKDFLGTNSTLEVLGQENGHRWLAYPEILINGVRTRDLLGRDDAHWNFNLDTDASVMEGNDIRDNGDGSFTTVAATELYSKLDRYIMGFIPAAQVPGSFFVSGSGADKGRAPQVGVTVRGTRVNVTVNQIIQAEGARVPAAAQSQKKFREAFILLSKTNQSTQAAVNKLDRIRREWQAFFHTQTGDMGTLDTTLP